MRFARVLVAALAAGVWVAAPAGAQTPTTAPAPVPAPAPAPVPAPAPAPTTTLAPRTTTTLARCDEPPPVAVRFTGTVTESGPRLVRFAVDTVAVGSLPAGRPVEVDYPDDARFLRPGTAYLVTAAADREVDRLVSKVRALRGTPAHCAAADPIVTTAVDGAPVDTGLLAGMSGNWSTALWYLVAPAAVAIGVLSALSIVKHLIGWTGRAAGRAVDRAVDRR
ncbi:MAG: hypothetical protein ACKO91_02725 [Acidimicrobiales bacterium]